MLRKQILIVDDEIFNIEAAKVILECKLHLKYMDFISDQAMNGLEALQKVKQNVEENNDEFCKFELILMDCNMPIMDGYEASKQIRAYLQSKRLP